MENRCKPWKQRDTAIFALPQNSAKKWQKGVLFDIDYPKITQVFIEKWAIFKKITQIYKLSIFSTDFISKSFKTSAYIFRVVCMSECPSLSDIVFTSTPK